MSVSRLDCAVVGAAKALKERKQNWNRWCWRTEEQHRREPSQCTGKDALYAGRECTVPNGGIRSQQGLCRAVAKRR